MNITPLTMTPRVPAPRTHTAPNTLSGEFTKLAMLVVSPHRLAYWNWAQFQKAAGLNSPAGLSILRRLKAEAVYYQKDIWEAADDGCPVDFKEVKAHLWAFYDDQVKYAKESAIPDRRDRAHY